MNSPWDDLAGRGVLITGAAGFVGRHLAARVRAAGARLAGVDRIGSAPADVDRYVSLDLGRADTATPLRELIREFQPEWIFHLAGGPQASVKATEEANSTAAERLLEAVAGESPNASVVVLGSAAEYGPVNSSGLIVENTPCDPITPYGRAKHAQTLLALDAAKRGLCVAVARPFNILGAGVPEKYLPGAVAARARDALAAGKPAIVVGNVNAERDFLAVEDAVEALLAVVSSRSVGEIFNLCSGEAVTIRRLVELILEQFPGRLSYHVDPELVRASDPPRVIGSNAALRTRFGWEPQVPLAASVAAVCRPYLAS